MSAHVLKDSATMFRRQMIHMLRYPMVLFLIGIPVIILLLFVYVFGATMGAGLGGVTGGRAQYLEYVIPGILLITIATGAQGTAIAVAMDMSEGIVARFRTMSISRAAFLAGHVASAVLQTMVSASLVVVVAVLIGYRPAASLVGWLGAAGLLAAATVALTWLSVGMGLVTKSVEMASNLPMPLMLLPFFGSGFVPTESLPAGLRWFAEYQPFTPIMEALRHLLSGAPAGSAGPVALVWCLIISIAGYLWSLRLYERRSVG